MAYGICDDCGQENYLLDADSDGYELCENCWPKYHDYESEPKKFWRYDGYENLRADVYVCVKETPAGWWIVPEWSRNLWYKEEKHFILKAAIKRYAQPTIELARESFIARKRRQVRLLASQLERAEDALKQAEAGMFDDKAECVPVKPIEWEWKND